MTRLTIEIHNEGEREKIKAFLEKLDARIVEEQPTPEQPNGKQVVALMEALAGSYSLSEIKDPVAWQREIRKDRPLPFRD